MHDKVSCTALVARAAPRYPNRARENMATVSPVRVAYGQPVEAGDDPRETTRRVMDEIERLHASL